MLSEHGRYCISHLLIRAGSQLPNRALEATRPEILQQSHDSRIPFPVSPFAFLGAQIFHDIVTDEKIDFCRPFPNLPSIRRCKGKYLQGLSTYLNLPAASEEASVLRCHLFLRFSSTQELEVGGVADSSQSSGTRWPDTSG